MQLAEVWRRTPPAVGSNDSLYLYICVKGIFAALNPGTASSGNE